MLHLSPRTRLILVILAASTLVGVVAAKLNTTSRVQVSAAAANVLIDFPGPSIVDRDAGADEVANLQRRAELYGRLLVTDPVLDRVARRAGIPKGQIAGTARTTASVPIPLREPGSEVRANQIRDAALPYHLDLQARSQDPILSIYSQAPTTAEAERLANSAVLGLQDYLRDLGRSESFPEAREPVLRQLGSARGGPVNPRSRAMTASLTFFVAFSLTAAILFGLAYLRRRRLGFTAPEPPPYDPDDNWPHTTRLLPWAIAGFICMLWLTPFNKIQLAFSTPIDMKLDRLVLPIIFGIWALAFAARGNIAPRLRLTPVHLALGVFLAVAFLSVVLNAGDLNQTLEFELSFKKLPLLVSYLSIFVIVASSVRPGEVRPYLKLTLVLAVVCAIGIIYEFRFGRNVFTVWTAKTLPGFFTLDADPSGIPGYDSLGRRSIVGPTDVGLEAVTMLAMAMPIVLVGLLSSDRTRRQKILYGLAACLLVAGMFGTGRKIALIAPAAVVLTFMYFRRRELVSLAPLGLVLVIVVTAISPGAVHGVVSQFTRSDRSSVATTSDRTADYDAIRPDLWTHLLFGRGYGSYTPDTYRILDSEILTRLVDTGVLGLLAFLGIGMSVILALRRVVARRDPVLSPVALVATASAVCFLTVSTLYDVSGFPHATYVFLYIAGLGSVALVHRPKPDEPAPELPEFDDAEPEPEPSFVLEPAGVR